MVNLVTVWNSYSPIERRNIAIYIGGIMFYKLGLEFFNGSIMTLAADRFTAATTFTKLGAASGINQAAQCVGAILIAPLIKKWPTRTVLSCAIFLFGVMTIILLIVDSATGGKMKPAGATKPHYGDWNPNLIFVVWTLAGITYGMVELIRRVIPADIVGGDVGKLRRMDATVHVFYEVAGTAGAFSSSSAISRFGNNYSFFLTPIFFAIAGAIWLFVSTLSFQRSGDAPKGSPQAPLAEVESPPKETNYIAQIFREIRDFFSSIYLGLWLVLGNRRFVWLFPAYSVALYLHRFLETQLASTFAKRILGNSAWAQIMVGGSNFGELLGALSVFVLSDSVSTPLPWLRLDALALNIVWVLPHFATFATKEKSWAWRIAGCFLPVSFGWAAGDVSLAAYIQSALSNSEFAEKGISALGSVMAFLYTSYIVLNAILGSLLGKVIDKDFNIHKSVIWSLKMVGGVQFSIASGLILAATLIPQGALAFNPKAIGDVQAPGRGSDSDVSGESDSDSDNLEKKKKSQIAV